MCGNVRTREILTATWQWSSYERTESACLATARWVGRGDKNAADGAAVQCDATLAVPQSAMTGTVIIGEGEKDDAPMLYNGEVVGDGSQPEVDVAVDPIDGTTLTAARQKPMPWQ